MKKLLLGLASASLAVSAAYAADHHKSKKDHHGEAAMVGSDKMYPSKTIVENASKASELSTLVAAVKAAGLVDTLNGKTEFTVFAPTNDAFSDIQGTVDTLLLPENKDKLTTVLTYHVVPGTVKAKDVIALVEDGNGEASVETVAGQTLTFSLEDGNVMVTDANGGTATVTTADVAQKNGVVHVVDAVLVPTL